MKTIDEFIDEIFKLSEGDGADPLTLINLILNKDLRHMGYNWGQPFNQTNPQQVLNLAGKVPPPVYIKEAKGKNEKTEKDGGEGQSAVPQQEQPQSGQAQQPMQVQTTTGEIIDVEQNKVNPQVISSLPAFNNCPAFFMKDMQSAPICRVTNRVCIYLNTDYKQCGIYNTASTSDPNTFELPLGKENTYAYLMGLKF